MYADELLNQASVHLASMGMAAIADEIGIELMAINPAGIHSQQNAEWVSGYTSHMQSAFTTAFSGISISPLKDWTVGLSGAIRSVDGIPETQGDGFTGTQIGAFSDTSFDISAALAYRITPRLSVGSGVGLFRQSVVNETASRLSVNVGIQYRSDIGRIGIAAQNALAAPLKWSTGRSDEAQIGYQLGYSTEIESIRLMGSVAYQTVPRYNVGVSTLLVDRLTVSAGIEDLASNWTASFGLAIKLDQTQVVYTYQQNQALGDSHKMGIKIEL